jgi:phosphoglycerate dehydrogenase-like enzyme
VDSVDVAAATERGIPVVVAPGGNTRSVAEHTLALIFATAKNIVDSDVQTRQVDEEALFRALSEQSIAGAGLDVLVQEPMKAGHPLFALPNLVVSPHLAAQTREATARGGLMAVNGTLVILGGKRWPHVGAVRLLRALRVSVVHFKRKALTAARTAVRCRSA